MTMFITLNGKKMNMNEFGGAEYMKGTLTTNDKPALLLFYEDSSDYVACICDTDEEYLTVKAWFKEALAGEEDFDFDEARRKAKEKLK